MEKHTDKELAEAFIFPSELSPEAQIQAENEFSEFRKRIKNEMTWKLKIWSRYLQFKYLIQDSFPSFRK